MWISPIARSISIVQFYKAEYFRWFFKLIFSRWHRSLPRHGWTKGCTRLGLFGCGRVDAAPWICSQVVARFSSYSHQFPPFFSLLIDYGKYRFVHVMFWYPPFGAISISVLKPLTVVNVVLGFNFSSSNGGLTPSDNDGHYVRTVRAMTGDGARVPSPSESISRFFPLQKGFTYRLQIHTYRFTWRLASAEMGEDSNNGVCIVKANGGLLFCRKSGSTLHPQSCGRTSKTSRK